MEIKIDKEDFVKGLYRVQSVVEKKVTMPILLNVLLETHETGISITATDLEIGIKGFYPAEIIKPGKSTLSAKKLYEVIKELPEKDISLRLKENHWMEISCGKSVFNILGLSAETFPTMPAYDEGDFSPVDVEVLREMIEKTIFAVSTDESRYNLTGVFWVKAEGDQSFRMVATDGYRISMIERPLKVEMKDLEKGLLLPKKGLAELNKLLNEGGEVVLLKIMNNNLIIKKDSVVLIMRLLDAEFPDYRQVIPSKTKRQIRLKRSQMLESLHRVSILSSEKTRGVKFIFTPDLLELSTYNPELGEAKEDLPIDYKGEEFFAGFNSRFILEVLTIFSSEEVVMELDDEKSPALLRPLNDEKHICVVMPMRV
jgi:DNA polymerase III subunit beta